MLTPPLRYHHWRYVWIPLAGAGTWFGMLWAMLIVWLAKGRPKYVSQEGSIAYISDIGAGGLKPLFIAGCSVTAAGFILSLVVLRYLRHSGRLMPDMRRREEVFANLAILGSVIGGAGLILLSIFDTKRFESTHRAFLIVFIVGVALSAIFCILEYRWLTKDYEYVPRLKTSYIAKAIIVTTLIVLAVAFAITLYVATDAGAVLEWVIAFGFTFYVLTFYYDLRLSKNVRKGELAHHRQRRQSDQYTHSQAESQNSYRSSPTMAEVQSHISHTQPV